jgi:hypothetical protein
VRSRSTHRTLRSDREPTCQSATVSHRGSRSEGAEKE